KARSARPAQGVRRNRQRMLEAKGGARGTEYAAVHTISAQAARRASRRLQRKPVRKSLNLRETRRYRVAVAGQVGNCGAYAQHSGTLPGSGGMLTGRTARPSEVVHQNQLDDERVRTAGESPTDPEFDAVAAFAVVEHGEERLRALGVREEALEGSEIGVVLERHGEALAECVRGARRGSEVELAEAVEVGFDDRVRNQVDAAEAHADDRPDLARKTARRPVRRVVAELEVDAVEKPALVSVRADEERPELHAVELQPAIAGERVDREIGPRLEPFGHAVGEFGHSVQRVLRHDASRDNRPGAARRGEVVVPGEVDPA